MKRCLILIFTVMCLSLMPANVMADELDDFEADTYAELAEMTDLEITPENLSEISTDKILNYVKDILTACIKAPITITATILVFSALEKMAYIFSGEKGSYAELFTIICFIAISSQLISSIEDIVTAMKACQDFLIGYIPIFASVVAASGNIKAATSYNAVLIYATEGATAAMTAIVKPLVLCMTVTSVIHAINQDMPNIISSIRRLIVTVTGFIMSIFLGVIGLQGIVGKTQDSLTLKASKYLISSFVPIIGGSLNESYRTVRASLEDMRSVIGTFGIVIILSVMCIPIIKGFVYRWVYILCEFLSGCISGGGISRLCKSLSDVYLLLTTLVTLYMLMMIIATGAIMALGGSSL